MKKPDFEKFNIPETPRAKGSEFNTLKESLDKAKKYDKLIEQLENDKETINLDILQHLADYKNQAKPPIKAGYVTGYVDGKIAAYSKMVNVYYNKYLKG